MASETRYLPYREESQVLCAALLFPLSLPKSAMNRSAILPASQEDSFSSQHEFPATTATRPFGRFSKPRTPAELHSFFSPIHYEAGYAYPLLVWLHGPDSGEAEVQQAMQHISLRNHVAVAPRGNAFSLKQDGLYSWKPGAHGSADAAERVRQSIEAAKVRFNVHPERIFVAGSATSGTLALRLAMENPGMFAGAISLGGRMPSGSSPLKRINEVRKTQILLSVSPDDSYSTQQVMEDLSLLYSADMRVDVRLHPAGDELTTLMLSEIDAWILEKSCPQMVSSNC